MSSKHWKRKADSTFRSWPIGKCIGTAAGMMLRSETLLNIDREWFRMREAVDHIHSFLFNDMK
jgi:hypothetical protein